MEQTIDRITDFAEAGELERRYVISGDVGPMTRNELRNLIRYGELTPEQEITLEGSNQRRPAIDFPELRRYFELAEVSRVRHSITSGAGTVPVTPAMPREGGNLLAALMLGTIAMLLSAGIWTAITVTTEYQIGFMAVGVGIAVGLGVRKGGDGSSGIYGVLGALLALAGCLIGNVLSGCYFIAQQESVAFADVVAVLTPALAAEILRAMFSPMDLLFYGLAIWEGFKISVGSHAK